MTANRRGRHRRAGRPVPVAPARMRLPATGALAGRAAGADRGSVTPLVLGMVVCLLLLGAGVTAATSAFLARQRLQDACDGAAAAAADAAQAGYYAGAEGRLGADPASAAARQYLSVRSPGVRASADTTKGSVVLRCSADTDVTMGGLFGVTHLDQSVRAVGHPVL